ASDLLKILIDSNTVTPLVQIFTGALLTKSKRMSLIQDTDSQISPSLPPNDGEEETEHHVHFDALPVEGQVFPVVQNEGIVAMILLLSRVSEVAPRITRYFSSLEPTFLKILTSGILKNYEEDENEIQFINSDESNISQEYPLEIKVNALNFNAKISPKFRKILLKILNWTKEKDVIVSPSYLESNPIRHEKLLTIERNTTKSAKPLLESQNSKIQTSDSWLNGEIITGFENPSSLKDAVGALLLIL
ncbi:hypothetical protein HK096_006948, partial [Nowakowskiella sp. JEL0078]